MTEVTILDKLPSPVLAVDLQSSLICYLNAEMEIALRIPKVSLIGQSVERLDASILSSDNVPFSRSFSAQISLRHTVPVKLKFPNHLSYVLRFQVSIEDNSVMGICYFQEYIIPREIIRKEAGVLNDERVRELRSVINNVLGIATLLKTEQKTEERHTYHKTIAEQLNTLLLLLNTAPPPDVSPVHKPEKDTSAPVLKKGEFNLAKSLKAAISDLLPRIREKELHLRFSCFDDLIPVKVPENEAMGLIKKLLLYAIAESEKGEIRCEVFHRMQGSEEQVCLRIVDCGHGLKQSVFELIEQPGNIQSDDVESVPGELLAIIQEGKRIARDYGGEFIFESQYGIGNTVAFILPMQQIPKTSPPVKKIAEPTQGLPSLLIVDDDSIVHQIIKRYLEGRCVFESAMDGRRAITAVGKQRFDIIFLDINLGVGLTGLQVARHIRKMQEYDTTPIVAITAYAMPGDKERAFLAGCDFYQSKPFSRENILDLYEKCLLGVSHQTAEENL